MQKTFVALDGMNKEEVFKLLEGFPQIKLVKVGLELYLRYGNDIVKEIASRFNIEIFLDLKLHDIPTTVAKSISALRNMPIKFLTIHASGGKEMLEAANISAKENLPDCQLLVVSILTSHENHTIEKIWGREYKESLIALLDEVRLSKSTGLVCSGQDLEIVKQYELQNNLKLIKVTPGIRLKDDKANDQKRVMTPELAMKAGSDYLVVGRSITKRPESILEGVYP